VNFSCFPIPNKNDRLVVTNERLEEIKNGAIALSSVSLQSGGWARIFTLPGLGRSDNGRRIHCVSNYAVSNVASIVIYSKRKKYSVL